MSESIEKLHAAGGDRLAVIGLGVDFPGCPDLETFIQSVAACTPVAQAQPGWSAAGSLSRAVAAAWQDAGWNGARRPAEVGWLWAGPGKETSAARAVADLPGPELDFGGYDEPLPGMLMQAHEWLESHQVDGVIVAGAALSAGPEGLPLFGFDRSALPNPQGCGSVALALVRLDLAEGRKLRIYAVLEGLAFHMQRHGRPSPARVQQCAHAVLRQANTQPDEIGLLEVTASGQADLDRAEIEGLSRAYPGSSLRTALGSAQSLIGDLTQVNGLAGLLRACVCLESRIRPGIPGWNGPKYPELWNGSTLYVLPSSIAWFHPGYPGQRKAAISLVTAHGSAAHLLLTGRESLGAQKPVKMRSTGLVMLPVGADTVPGLVAALEGLRSQVQSGTGLNQIARAQYDQSKSRKDLFRAAILGKSQEDVVREIDFAMRGIPTAAEKGQEWQTPAGSYFTPRPLGPDSPVAFVYPGAFNSYLGVGKDLFTLFPDLYDRFTRVAEDLSAAFCEEQLYPRIREPLSKEQLERMEASLLDDAYATMMSGISVSVALTTIFRDIFELRVDSAFGYSLGENSMMFAMGVWGDGNRASLRLKHSPMFHNRLAGPQNAVREFWGLPVVPEGQMTGELWANFLLMAPPEKVLDAMRSEPRVYLTHINTPRQVVIAGDPASCKRVIDQLKCNALRAPFNYVLHCEAMRSEYASIEEMHTWPIFHVPPVRLYSAAEDRPFEITSQAIAAAVAEDLCSPLDFVKLIQTVYADGARIFLELGAGSNCAKWVEETLRGQPVLAVSANRKGVDDASAILRVLARLVSHEVRLNLDPLYAVV